MPADPFSLLELDHRHVAQLLDQLGDSKPGPERERAVKDLEESLAAHMKFEELKVYPLVVTEIGAEAAKEAETEHGLARDGLAKVVELVAEPGFGAAVESLKAGITHHVEEEEGEMFPKLRAGTPDQVQDELAHADAGRQEGCGPAGRPPGGHQGAARHARRPARDRWP